jgi:trehalose-phosphatase
MASLFLPYSYSSEDFTIYKNFSLAGSVKNAKGSVTTLSSSASLKKILSNTSLKQTKERLKLKAKASQRLLRQQQQREQSQKKERLQERLLKKGSSSSFNSSTSDMVSSPLSSPSIKASVENISRSLSSRLASTDSLKNSKENIQKQDLEKIISIKPSMLGNVGLQNTIASVSLPTHYPRKPEEEHTGNIDNNEHNTSILTDEILLNNSDLMHARKIWFGLPGEQSLILTDDAKEVLTNKLINYDCVPVFIDQEQFHGHYNQVCKQIIWKAFHYQLPEYPKSANKEQQWWNNYREVNEKFAEVIAKHYQPGDIIWVNDYHLMFLPKILRKLIPNAAIGFFLHIPFPSSEIIRCIYAREQILEGLLGADLVGFQTYSFMRHFVFTVSRLLGYEATLNGIQLENSVCSVGIFPIGIDLDAINEKRKDKKVIDIKNNLLEKYSGMKLIIGRDKNDYVKGVRHKLASFEKFLKIHPEWIGKVVLIQVALSTVEQNELECQVSNLVARINSRFGSLGYSPVVYLQQDIPYEQYLALLTIADVFLITSVRDGMNLTSHEFIACQSGHYSPLIISEFAGSYGSFGTSALRVNPWDYCQVAEAINEALTMSEEEKEIRWNELFTYIRTNSAQFYVESFVNELLQKYNDNQKRKATILPKLKLDIISNIWISSRKKLLFLGISEDKIKSPSEMKVMNGLISELLKDPMNHVYILSDALKDDMNEYSKSLLPQTLNMVAENGAYIKGYDQEEWELQNTNEDLSWKKHLLKILNFYTERILGTYIEERTYSIIWHYEKTNYEEYSWQISEAENHIHSIFSINYPLRVIHKQDLHSIIITPRNVNKGSIIRRIIEKDYYDADLVFCIGDNESDESMFAYCRLLQDKMNSMQVPKINSPLNTTTNYYYNSNGSIHSPILSMTSKSSSPTQAGGFFGFSSSPSSSFKRYSIRNQLRRKIITCAIHRKFTKAKYIISNFNEIEKILEVLSQQHTMVTSSDEDDVELDEIEMIGLGVGVNRLSISEPLHRVNEKNYNSD